MKNSREDYKIMKKNIKINKEKSNDIIKLILNNNQSVKRKDEFKGCFLDSKEEFINDEFNSRHKKSFG